MLALALAAVVSLPGFRPAPSPPTAGTLLTGTFPGGERPGFVYLPPGFSPARRYPVLYLLHGLRGSPAESLEGAGLLPIADAGVGDGRLRPFVAVMPAAGPDRSYDGEWAGRWEQELVDRVVPWVDAHLPTVRGPRGRVLAGLSAGGYGAADIALRHPRTFGVVEGWGGYYHPLRDGQFRSAGRAALDAHDPFLLARREAATLRRARVRFFLSTGPAHSHWFAPAETFAFAREVRGLGIEAVTYWHAGARGQWHAQLAHGLEFAFRARAARASSGSGATSARP